MIICVVGPTAVGKTKLSVELAKKYNAVIINADSTQVYQGMNIGTAKVTEAEKEGISHYLFDIVPVTTNYTVYDYQKDVRTLLDKFSNQNIILVGGSGLYIKAALYNYVFEEEEQSKNDYSNLSNQELYDLAKKKDENMDIHPNNRKRLIRFLNKKQTLKEECKLLYDNVLFIGLTTDRETLYERINKRTLEMLEQGLEEEVKSFYDAHIETKEIYTAIGYKELYKYFSGEITKEEAILLIQKNCRHYAKRQYTWFNNQLPVTWFNVDFENFNNTINDVINYINERE